MPQRERHISLGQLASLLHKPTLAAQFAQPVPAPKADKESAKIIIKQQVKQVVNRRKQRKKRSDPEKVGLKAMRKEYARLKKATKAKLTAAKKEELKKRLAESKDGKAKKQIRSELKAKLAKLLKQIPGASKAKYETVRTLLVKVKGLTWV